MRIPWVTAVLEIAQGENPGHCWRGLGIDWGRGIPFQICCGGWQ